MLDTGCSPADGQHGLYVLVEQAFAKDTLTDHASSSEDHDVQRFHNHLNAAPTIIVSGQSDGTNPIPDFRGAEPHAQGGRFVDSRPQGSGQLGESYKLLRWFE